MNDSLTLRGHLAWQHFRGGICIDQDAGRQTITTVGKQWLVDKLQDFPPSTDQVKFHQTGTSGTVATAGDAALTAVDHAAAQLPPQLPPQASTVVGITRGSRGPGPCRYP